MSREGYARFLYVVREDYAFFDVSREMDPRASSGKFWRVKSRYPENFRFLALWKAIWNFFEKNIRFGGFIRP